MFNVKEFLPCSCKRTKEQHRWGETQEKRLGGDFPNIYTLPGEGGSALQTRKWENHRNKIQD